MHILDSLKQLRDDLKAWVTNNLNAINTKLNNKVDKIEGKSLSTNDFTDDYKTKLDNLGESNGGDISVETDPTVPDWAKAPTKPTYTASEVGAEASGAVSAHDTSTTAHNDIRLLIQDKLNSSELNNAINTALAQAKSSGEFDGADGYSPVRGTDYWTEADKDEIKAYIRSYIDQAILGGEW